MGRTRRLRNNSATRSQSPLPSLGARRPPLVESQAGWVAEPVSPTTHFNQDSNYGRRRFAGVGLRKEIYDLRGYDAPGGNPAWAPYFAGPKTSAAARIIQHAVRRHQQRRRNRRSAVQQAREATLTGRGRTWNARPAKKDVRYPARQPVTRAQSAHRLANDRRKMDGIVKIRRADTREQVNRWVLGQIIQDAAHDVAVFGGPEWQSQHDHWQGELDKEIASAARDRQEGAILIAASARKADQNRARKRPAARQPVTRAQAARRLASDRRKVAGIEKIKHADRKEDANRLVTGDLIAMQRGNIPAQAYWRAELEKQIAESARDRQEGAILLAASARRADQRRAGRKRRVVRR